MIARWIIFTLCILSLGSIEGAIAETESPPWQKEEEAEEPYLFPPEPLPPAPDNAYLTGKSLQPLPRPSRLIKPAPPGIARPLPPPSPRFAPNAPPALTIAYPLPGGKLPEGLQTFVWHTSGPIASVQLTYEGELCRLGERPRGSFRGLIGKFPNTGTAQWRVPWLDGTEITIKITGYDETGKELASDQRSYQFWPRVLENKPETCIVVSKARQRLYYVESDSIRRMHIVSTALPGYTTPRMRPGAYDRLRGAMGRVFRKAYAPRSRMYRVVMHYWLQITSTGSHGIHATSPRFYGRLGRPASHGCIRQHREDARILYFLVSVGTPVYVE